VLGQHLDLIDEGGDTGECIFLRARKAIDTAPSAHAAVPLDGDAATSACARRTRTQQVLMLIGFDAIWQLLEHRDQSPDWENQTTQWVVRNDSPSGFALDLESGQTNLIRPGTPVLIKGLGHPQLDDLRRPLGAQQSVRPGGSGVELLSHGAQAATVVFRDRNGASATSGRGAAAATAQEPSAAPRAHVPLRRG
jgi:hypothetical protein